MPKVTDAHREARRQQILTAAFTCFGREGFHDTTMQDICDEAELSPGAVYNYFNGKADLIRAIAEESRDSLDLLFDAVDHDQPAPEVLAGLMERLGTFVEQPDDAKEGGHHVRVRLWSEALSTADVREPFQENLDDIIERFANIIRKGQKHNTIKQNIDPERLARALLAFHHGMVLQKALSSDTSVTPGFEALSTLLRDTAS